MLGNITMSRMTFHPMRYKEQHADDVMKRLWIQGEDYSTNPNHT